jgi:hypothetical protein
MVLLKPGLINCIRIAGWFDDAIVDALRSIVLRQRRGVKASWRFRRTLLRDAGDDNRERSYSQK